MTSVRGLRRAGDDVQIADSVDLAFL